MHNAVSNDTRLIATKRHVACTVSGEVVILHLDEGVYYGLNAVGTRVWQLLDQPRRVDEIIDALVAEFDVDRERCAADVRELIEQLVSRGLVTLGSEESGAA